MALSDRPIQPKSPKIKNSPLIQNYRSNHKQCEICSLEGDETPSVEIHHITPGAGRTDKLWNIAALCQNHHNQCTEHTHGDSAKKKNIILFGLKYLKGEITDKKLHELELHDVVMVAVRLLEPTFKRYKEGKT